MLIIQPIGGLCNRMRSISSAVELAKRKETSLLIVWFRNEELGCDFDMLFQIPSGISLLPIHSKWNLKKLFLQFTSQYISNEEIRSHRSENHILSETFEHRIKKRCYIATEEQFFSLDSLHLFKPLPHLQEKINTITASFQNTVGVHIRRTDNLPAIAKSSTASFAAAMEKELSIDPETSFYLATDDALEEARLKELFPGKILTYSEKDLSRNSVKGMEDALIDLYCLASTRKIIGSYFSSFTDIAAALHHIPKEIAQ